MKSSKFEQFECRICHRRTSTTKPEVLKYGVCYICRLKELRRHLPPEAEPVV